MRLLNNNFQVDIDEFVTEEDIKEIYERLTHSKKLVSSKSVKSCNKPKGVGNVKSPQKTTKPSRVIPGGKNTYSEFAHELENFTVDICHEMNKKINETVSQTLY